MANDFQTNGGRGLMATAAGQQFQTIPAPNTGLALYMLQIRAPAPASAVSASFIFPLSPRQVRKESMAYTNYYDVAGSAANQGVQRIIDIYGISPVTYIIEGTTGWKFHKSDGYQFTGLQAVSAIENLLATWANLNQTQIAAGNNNMYELWFFDFFRNQFWSVVPIGPQGVRQSEARPILVDYQFRLVGVYPLGAAPTQPQDTLATTLSQPATTSSNTLQTFSDNIDATYQGDTAAAS